MVSIIILVQDRYEYLKRCVDSILEHTPNTPYELVFVVQGVKNPLILNYLAAIPHFARIIINEYNTGVTPGRNTGIEFSKGDFLLFFDDDAWVSEELDKINPELHGMDWLQRLLMPYSFDSCGIVGQSGTYINPQTPGVFWECKTQFAECDVVQGYCFMFSRAVVDAIGGLDPYFAKFWHEESEYALHAKSAGFKVYNMGYIGVTHYGSGSGDDGTYGQKISYMFSKWQTQFSRILVPRQNWK